MGLMTPYFSRSHYDPGLEIEQWLMAGLFSFLRSPLLPPFVDMTCRWMSLLSYTDTLNHATTTPPSHPPFETATTTPPRCCLTPSRTPLMQMFLRVLLPIMSIYPPPLGIIPVLLECWNPFGNKCGPWRAVGSLGACRTGRHVNTTDVRIVCLMSVYSN